MSQSMTYEEFVINEIRIQYEPLRRYDWDMRAKARLHGYLIPPLCGDLDLGITKNVNVVDDFGKLVGSSKLQEQYA
jgi:hypothetical protein